MARRDNNTRLIYSTGESRVQQPERPSSQAPPWDVVIRVSRETKGRKGKGMTIITGVPLSGNDMKDLTKQLKQKFGTGGTVKGDVIEIQGDHRDKLIDELASRGWTVKRAGG
ncbi:TPA: stress response translation initiation inhibitor YciH [Candidatus Latescibacteria bacterium]|nr:stress response translation initiation inhibitor YciH [Candidatus Latescibacterota bacterium]